MVCFSWYVPAIRVKLKSDIGASNEFTWKKIVGKMGSLFLAALFSASARWSAKGMDVLTRTNENLGQRNKKNSAELWTA